MLHYLMILVLWSFLGGLTSWKTLHCNRIQFSKHFILKDSSRPVTDEIVQQTTIKVLSKPYLYIPKLPDLSQSQFPDIPEEDEFNCNYDLIVIGSGPGGEAG